ncbi:MAG: hypothetical protein J6Y82_07410, partial [Bacteroidales bacterium]|nr:hypothetical protein [Bacteroidales bacterium]
AKQTHCAALRLNGVLLSPPSAQILRALAGSCGSVAVPAIRVPLCFPWFKRLLRFQRGNNGVLFPQGVALGYGFLPFQGVKTPAPIPFLIVNC